MVLNTKEYLFPGSQDGKRLWDMERGNKLALKELTVVNGGFA